MMLPIKNKPFFFDADFPESEQLPKKFKISFQEEETENGVRVRVLLNDQIQVGDSISDNSREPDFYRYHDVFHYTFASLLGWSPCARALMKCKRKSQEAIDEFEDGARATITEEAISLLIFNEARRKSYFQSGTISNSLLKMIKEMTEPFEVNVRSAKEWRLAILAAYKLFRKLVENRGGTVFFDAEKKVAHYQSAA